jgi:hypothetical protein
MNWLIIIFFLISISLFMFTHYLRTKKEKRQEDIEHFETEIALTPIDKLAKYHNITLQFKNANDARKLINKNAQYLQNMNQPNLIARDCTSIGELYDKYLNAFDDISDNERKTIIKFILELLDKIKPRNPAYYNYLCDWIRKICIAKAKPWLEAGMPHTLENTIIMDANWFTNPRQTTFVHELTHVNQRIVPFEFEDLYKDFGYIEYPEGVENIKGMNSVIVLNRNNPDGLSPNWIWYEKTGNNYWWIGAVFSNATPNNLSDVSNVALKLETDRDGMYYYLKQQPTLLNTLKEFNTFFGNNPNNYHPNEMAAKFSESYLEFILGISENDNQKYNCEGFKIYKQHFEKIIQSFYSK